MSDAGRNPTSQGAIVNRVALAAGRTVGRYEITSVLGQGGFGITYRARDLQLGRDVAIKEYLPTALAVRQDGTTVLPRSTEVASDFAWGRDRFVAEGRTLAALHEAPAIVRVFDFLEANGTAYIVMEFLRGETLERRLRLAGPLSPVSFDVMLWPLLDGLQRVHEAGFLHRDIKPANILLSADGRPALIDFGASRAAIAGRTTAMTAVFTPGYAAPEQFATARQGPWTDIYGLAATLHCAITGRAPPSAIDRLMRDRYERLAVLQPQGFALAALLGIDAGLLLEAGARPQSIAAWRAVFSRSAPMAEETLLLARSPRAPQAARSAWPIRRTALSVAGATAVALLAAASDHVLAPPQQLVTVAPADDRRTVPQQADTERQKAESAGAVRQPSETSAPRQAIADPAGRKREPEVRKKAKPDVDAAAPITQTAQEEASTRSVPSLTAALDGTYGGSLTEATTALGGVRLISATIRLTGGTISGEFVYPRCGASATALTIAPSGEISGTVGIPDAMACRRSSGMASGRMTAAGLQLELRGVGTVARGTLVKGRPPLPPASTEASSAFDGAYAGSLSGSTAGGQAGLRPLSADLRVTGGRLTGRLIHPTCGASQVALPVDGAGAINGTVRIYEAVGCSLNDATLRGKVSANALTLDIRAIDGSARGSLAKRAN